jgi:hypothetical protein
MREPAIVASVLGAATAQGMVRAGAELLVAELRRAVETPATGTDSNPDKAG